MRLGDGADRSIQDATSLPLTHPRMYMYTEKGQSGDIKLARVHMCMCVCVARAKDDTSKRKRLWMVGVVSEGLVKRWKS